MYTETKNIHDCCGCQACMMICGKNAITMSVNEEGFAYPVLNSDKCVRCGLCAKVCPMEKDYVREAADPDIYAVKSKSGEVLQSSSSGGMFSILSRWILDRGGVVYGAAFDESFRLSHIRGETDRDILKMRTSKYVESDISGVYEAARSDLLAGRYVLLTGTPCQISALLAWLKMRHVPTDTLYTMDVICHGVPSRKVWADYVDILRKDFLPSGHRITGINMRSKKVSWEKQEVAATLDSGEVKLLSDFSFNRLFLSLNITRPSCFHCRYTSYQRVSDFTLGDFWNFDQARLRFDPRGGVNEVLVNTAKGRALFEQVRENADIQPLTKEVAWQPHLEYPAKEPAGRAKFWNEYLSSEDKKAVISRYMKGSFVTRVIHAVTPLLRKTGLYTIAGKCYKLVFGKK